VLGADRGGAGDQQAAAAAAEQPTSSGAAGVQLAGRSCSGSEDEKLRSTLYEKKTHARLSATLVARLFIPHVIDGCTVEMHA